MYNVPGRTGINILPSTVVRLANECPNIVGYKAASGNLAQIKELVAMKPPHFDLFSGDDALTVDIMEAGGVGVISVFGNVYPKQCVELIRLLEQGKYEEAAQLSEKYSEIFKLLFVDGNPAGAKAQLATMGYIKNVLRLPLIPASAEVTEALRVAGEKI
jgi:4-hydroxy-tetrahydrodipicolinate synthase